MQTRLNCNLQIGALSVFVIFNTSSLVCKPTDFSQGASQISRDSIRAKIKFINTSFENASQFNWAIDSTGVVVVDLIYDHERSSPNRANQHWHFQVQADPGTDLTLILRNFDNIWNGIKASPISDRTPCYISQDGITWTAIKTELLSGNRLQLNIHMNGDMLYVASLEPYRISDLQKLITEIKNNDLVEVSLIGKTTEGRPLEIIRVGNPTAPYRVFLRARAHGFETGGNWVVQGLVRSLLQRDAAPYHKKYCVYILPMANKDAVAQGRTRFNAQGMDLNRNWDKPADPRYSPENYALETWLKSMIAKGKKPDLAIDLHNDRGGNLHVSHPLKNPEEYFSHAQRLESLLYVRTWFTEGKTSPDFRNPGSIGEGLLDRFDIDAFIYELNFEWIAGLNKVPSAKDWELLGKELREVFLDYFSEKN